MKHIIRKNKRQRVVSVEDLSFLRDRNHRYNWFQRHFVHHRLRLKLKKAKTVYAADERVATDLVKYYFVSKDKIVLRGNNIEKG